MKQKIPIIILITVSLFLLALITPSFIHNKKHENSNNQLVASHIYGLIAANIERPIGITSGLSSDEFLIRTLEDEVTGNKNNMEEMMSAYLSSLKKQFGYDTAYVISENTKRYYTASGIAKIVNPQEDPYDNWYPMFLESGNQLQVQTERDQLFDYRWSIFINSCIKDSNDNIIGVCGMALPMENWQKMLLPIEKEYRVKINLIDSQGLVQVDTDFNNIKNAYISDVLTYNKKEDNFILTPKGKTAYRISRYLPSLNWYLVIQGNNDIEGQKAGKNIIIFINLFLISAILLIIFDNKKILHHDFVKSSLPEDELTGLPNRNYLKVSYGELGVFNTTRYKTLAVFDIDHFKIVNDDRDGDKIILAIVDIAKKAFGEKGIIFRWSGDEFVLFLEININEAESTFSQFCMDVKEAKDVTVSVGLVEVDLSVSIKTNYYRAVQACYLVKENGGNGVGKK